MTTQYCSIITLPMTSDERYSIVSSVIETIDQEFLYNRQKLVCAQSEEITFDQAVNLIYGAA